MLASGFLRLHIALEAPTTRLERDEHLAEWLRVLVERAPGVRPQRRPLNDRDDKALRAACDHLVEQPERNVGLDELATAAGIGKFRLIRLFREQTGLPPHALQVAHRVRAARRLLEAGQPIADAAATGFADQSHLHRHLQRSLGSNPRRIPKALQRLSGADEQAVGAGTLGRGVFHRGRGLADASKRSSAPFAAPLLRD